MSVFKKVAKDKEVKSKQELAIPEELIQSSTDITSTLKTLKITNDKSYDVAAGYLSMIASVKKEFEEKRKFFVKPLNDHVKNINEMFKTYTDGLSTADMSLRRKLIEYRAKQNALAETTTKPVSEIATKQTHNTSSGRVTAKKVWKHEIEMDTKVPREYCSPDSTKIRGAIDMGIRDIPGVRIYEEEVLSVGTK